MSDPIPDEWADKLTETMRGRAAVYGKPVEPGPLREDAKAALAVIAPLIAAQALLDASDALVMGHKPDGVSTWQWLRDRADLIETGAEDD